MNPPAGFWRRYAAYSLDATLVGLLVLPLLWSRLAASRHAFDAGVEQLQWRLWELLDDAMLRPEASPFELANEWAADPALQAGMTSLATTVGGALLQFAVPFPGVDHQTDDFRHTLGIGVEEVRDAFAHGFLRSITIQAFGTFVPVGDAVIQVPDQDGIARLVQEGGLLPQACI